MKVLVVFGTRPEAIKMCPLIHELKKHKEIECKVCLTGQHREMLHSVLECFDVEGDYDLNIMQSGQTLTDITTFILVGVEKILIEEQPDIVLVHGDTTTSFAAALAAFYQKIKVGHVEAGLRTGNRYSPYPEEMNRCLTGKLATYHFAPTEGNRKNLFKENITDNVYVTGNTVIDAFKTTIKENYEFKNEMLRTVDFSENKVILVTAHRRENLGESLEHICRAMLKIVEEVQNAVVIYPVHMNPKVRETVLKYLDKQNRILLTEPLDVLDMHNLMAKSYFVMTDSGGLQEEAPALGKPVLVMRTETERPEALETPTVELVGVEEENIYYYAIQLLTNDAAYNKMAQCVTPYGDGFASERIVDILLTQKG